MSDSLGGANIDKSVNNNSPMGSGNPGTPQDQNSHPLRHPDTPHNPGTPHSAAPSSGNAPHTPMTSNSGSLPLSHGGAGAASTPSNSAAISTANTSSTNSTTTQAANADQNNANNQPLPNNDPISDLNFDPAAIIDGENTDGDLDVSKFYLFYMKYSIFFILDSRNVTKSG